MSAVARRYYVRGRAALGRGDVEGAMEALGAAVDLAPTFVAARVGYAGALTRFGDIPRAAQVLRAGLGRQAPAASEALLWASLGDVLAQSGDFPGADTAYGNAAREPTFAPRVAAGRARVHAKLGQYREAFAELAVVAKAHRDAEQS